MTDKTPEERLRMALNQIAVGEYSGASYVAQKALSEIPGGYAEKVKTSWLDHVSPKPGDTKKEAIFRAALNTIAEEENIYIGHGDFRTEPLCSADGAQTIARSALERGDLE